MADDQAKFDVKLGVSVEGTETAAQRLAKLQREISNLEKTAQQMRGVANIPVQMQDLIRSSYKAAQGFTTAKDQAKALGPAISSIGEALRKTGLSQDVLKTVGLDDKSLKAAGRNTESFRGFIEDLAKARSRAIQASTQATGRAESLQAERGLLQSETNRQQRIRDEAARKAVAQDKATELQRTQVTMAGVKERVAIAKQAVTQTSSSELQAARAQAAGALRAVLRQASQSPFGAANRPTLRELTGAGNLQLADRRQIAAAATREAPAGSAEKAVGGLAAAASEAAAALRNLPKALSTGLAADKRAMADFHKQLRVSEASVYPKGAYARRASGAGGPVTPPTGVAPEYENIARSAGNAARAIGGVKKEQDAILGQVRNVVGMAFGYQALQAIAGELNQVFGHLKSGVVEYNSMIESTTVGFTTLFKNQAKAAYDQASTFDAAKIKVDYLQMGYKDAESAAAGMINTIREFANVTPFRFAELQESALRMRAFGFDMQEILRKDKDAADGFSGGIVAVGNAVSSLGGGADAFRRITYALGQMKQAGRVYQNDMMQLANAGIGGYRYIANSLKEEISKNADGTMKVMSAEEKKLYAQLESNAIETVRRLTTNGQISGEAAARAILQGLEKDFGGGMAAQAKTFVGAFSTVADMSQSLVADAFKPLYDSIRDTTYQFSVFLQKTEIRDAALAFSKNVKTMITSFSGVGTTISTIAGKVFGDFTRAISSAGDRTRALGGVFQSTFGSIATGIGAIGDLLMNDYSRALLFAATATKAIFSFGASNPFLAQIMLIVAALGALKTAIDQDIMGIGTAFRDLQRAAEPFVAVLRDQLAPLIADIANSFVSTLLAAFVSAVRIIEPGLTLILTLLTKILDFIGQFKGPLASIGVALAAAFIGSKIINGFRLLSSTITELIFKFEQLAVKARLYRLSLEAPKGKMLAFQTATRQVRNRKTGEMMDEEYYTGAYRYVKKPKVSAPTEAGQIPQAAAMRGVSGVFSGLSKLTSFVGLSGILIGELGQLAGLPAEITNTVSGISSALLTFSMLKSVVPPGTFSAISTGMGEIFKTLKSYAAAGFAKIAAQLRELSTAIKGLAAAEVAATALTKLKGAILAIPGIGFLFDKLGLILGGFKESLVAGVPLIGAALAAILAALGLSEMAKGIGRSNVKKRAEGMGMNLTDEEAKKIEAIGRKFSFGFTRDQLLAEGFTEADLKLFEKYYFWVQKSMNAFREGERSSAVITKEVEKTAGGFTTVAEQSKLLVASQKASAAAQEKLNALLAVAQQSLAGATGLLEELATSVLQDILNPDTRTNPYTHLEQLGLTLEEQLAIEQEMGFTQFENAQGLTRSFSEYKDILDSIKPLTEDETAAGEISLKMVKERLKIETERRKEQERIKRLAEAEYDLGLAVLQQYDESIDPLQRAVQLRSAQKKYTQDIADIQFQSLQDIISEAEASDAWAAATAATKKRLKDLQKGQQLILDEMKRMFEDYNRDIADIMANPSLTAEQKKNAATERLNQLKSDLESKFGITEDMITAKIGEFNSLMGSVIDTLGLEGQNLKITWGETLVANLQSGGFGVLISYMQKKLAEVIALAARIKAAADVSGDIAEGAAKTAKALADKLSTRLQAAIVAGKLGPTAQINFRREIAKLSRMTDLETIVTTFNNILGKMIAGGFASGGIMPANKLSLVGERGPELVLPQSRGLVLNNSISSRLLGMLSGTGSQVGNNVTINVNNPVVRSDADIRKLATEISRVQASQFRTQGGRLY